MSLIWQKVYPVIIAVLFFELIILVHEGGHFIAAKLMKIKVNEFSVGMGPKLFGFKKGDTDYSFRLIPFGGYCAMEGEDEKSNDSASFENKTVLQRIFVVCAGALMNLIMGLVIISIMVSTQNLIGIPVVADFEENAVSSQTLMKNDRIKAIDGMRVYTATDVFTGLSRSRDENVEFTVLRDGSEINIDVPFAMNEENGTRFISLDFYMFGNEKTFSSVIKETFAQFVSFCRIVFLSVSDLISGRFGVSDLSGPVGAVSAVSSAVKSSLNGMLRITALLSVNIGLFNLFPFPALDGWKLFALIFEGLFKKRMPQKLEWAINSVGLALLLGLMCFVTFSDITKLF
ncbi:site-2 protease family protein [uncultured Eubacterium sp.]|uniref:M50 family metallopeptidase n=1 Tax=uncultured Eubacterium sp. TaxID=165185 RepID=UPI0015AD9D64|nr:site-2 protease family protein [uncultured Eubacterium sp.]